VLGRGDTVIKNIYYAEIERFEDHPAVDETDGAVLIDALPDNLLRNPRYSFMMKDRVLPETMRVLYDQKLV
jgi:8-oxo-dGTP diphosphatase